MKSLNKDFKTWAIHKELYVNIHTNFIHNSEYWKQQKYPYTGEINKLQYIFKSKILLSN